VANFPSAQKKNLKEKFIYAFSVKPVNNMTKSELFDITTEHTQDIFKDIHQHDDLTSLFLAKSSYHDRKLKVSKEELYVGNLDRNTKYDELMEFLRRFGEVEYLKMSYDKRGKFLGHAFARFKIISLHDEVISQSGQFSLNGRKVILGEKVEKQITLEDIEKKCWFCFNNPNIDSDLILKEFTEFYLAYPKGPVDDFHFLLLPKKHIPCFLDLNETQKSEFVSILETLTIILKDNNLDYLIYEKNLPYKEDAAKHMIINIIGIGKEFSFNFLDQMELILGQSHLKYKEFDSRTSIKDMVSQGQVKNNQSGPYYYYIDAPTGIQFGKSGIRTKILVDVHPHTKDYNDYPRKIICSLIDKEERFNWKRTDINKEFLVSLKDKLAKYFK
jgi:hypothetical protein